MEVTVDTESDLVSGVADLRRIPLRRLAREHDPDAGVARVLPDRAESGTVPVAAFNSSI